MTNLAATVWITHQVSSAGPGGSIKRSQRASWRRRSWSAGRGKAFWLFRCCSRDDCSPVSPGLDFPTSRRFPKQHHDSRRQKRAVKRTGTQWDWGFPGRNPAQTFSDGSETELLLLSLRSYEDEEEDGAPWRSAHFLRTDSSGIIKQLQCLTIGNSCRRTIDVLSHVKKLLSSAASGFKTTSRLSLPWWDDIKLDGLFEASRPVVSASRV